MKHFILALIGTFLISSASASSQDREPLTFVVPVPVGGTFDKVARTLQKPLMEATGRNVLVQNLPGANTVIGAREVNNYTGTDTRLLLVGTANVINNDQFEAMTNIMPIYYLGAVSETVFARPNLKYNTAAELVKNSTERLTMAAYSQGGDGSSVFKAATKKSNIDLIYYKGSAQALVDVASGTLDLATAPPVNVVGAVETGKIKLLGINGSRRHPDFPNTPTMAEQGFNIPPTLRFYIFVNKTADPAAVAKLTQAIDTAVRGEEFTKARTFLSLFAEPVRGSIQQHFVNSVNSVYEVIGTPVKK